MRHTVFAIALLLAAGHAAAATYKWVDEQGKTHYGDTIPPQYANQGKSELNKKGREVNKTEAISEAERKEREARRDEDQKHQRQQQEQKRRDNALLASYANEKEIDLARDRNLQQTSAYVDSAQVRLKTAKNRLGTLKQQADAITKTKKPVPADLTEDIKRAEGEVQKVEGEIADKQKEAEAIKARFDADKLRYRELTQQATAKK